jgi:hypothetical protein
MAGISVQVRGLPEVQKMLGQLEAPEAKKVLQKATKAGGQVAKKALVAAAPYPDLKRAVWARAAKRQRPAYVVGHHKKNGGFIWHMVVGGTKDHGPRRAPWIVFRSKSGAQVVTQHVRGVKPNPFVARAYAASESAAMAAVEKVVEDYLAQIAGA